MAESTQSKAMATNTDFRKFGMRDKMGYMFGDFGNDFFFILVSSFLMVYYTDVLHISAASVGVSISTSKIMGCCRRCYLGTFYRYEKAGKSW